jgi:tetratricopeptide (TPR) repeat protein
MKRISRPAAVFLSAALLLFGAFALRDKALAYHQKLPIPDSVNYLPANGVIKAMSLGFDEVVADYFYLQAIQFFGDRKLPDGPYLTKLYPLIDLTTELAPNFEYLYKFGHITITLTNENSELSKKILLKGLVNLPGDWVIPYYLAFDYWFLDKNPAAASVFYDEASRNAPPQMKWLKLLAARMMSDASNPDLAITMLEDMLNRQSVTGAEIEKERIKNNLLLAYMERDLQRLEKAVAAYKRLNGKCPPALGELSTGGFIDSIPVEPHGGSYGIRPDCSVFSTASNDRFRPYK